MERPRGLRKRTGDIAQLEALILAFSRGDQRSCGWRARRPTSSTDQSGPRVAEGLQAVAVYLIQSWVVDRCAAIATRCPASGHPFAILICGRICSLRTDLDTDAASRMHRRFSAELAR
jgi:hypothetical protein